MLQIRIVLYHKDSDNSIEKALEARSTVKVVAVYIFA